MGQHQCGEVCKVMLQTVGLLFNDCGREVLVGTDKPSLIYCAAYLCQWDKQDCFSVRQERYIVDKITKLESK